MSEITFKQAISDALAEEMRRDDKVFMMGEELGPYNGCFGVTKGFLDEFGPDRIMDCLLYTSIVCISSRYVLSLAFVFITFHLLLLK